MEWAYRVLLFRIVSQLASQLDLNSLDSLSRTCRQFRATLLLYRDQLVKRTLQCGNEDSEVAARRHSHLGARWTTGKVGKCARDLVTDCRNCGMVVCRVSITYWNDID
jgi:hypothetical protein